MLTNDLPDLIHRAERLMNAVNLPREEKLDLCRQGLELLGRPDGLEGLEVTLPQMEHFRNALKNLIRTLDGWPGDYSEANLLALWQAQEFSGDLLEDMALFLRERKLMGGGHRLEDEAEAIMDYFEQYSENSTIAEDIYRNIIPVRAKSDFPAG